jgi:hypothetical protein
MSQLDQFMAAIRQRESSGNYAAYNDKTHEKYGNARGAYQIMSNIWPGWAKQAGIPTGDWRDPKAQDAVARHVMSSYYQEFGDWRLVAAAWHGGRGAAMSIRDGKGWGKDMDGTDTTDYMEEVVGMMGDPQGDPPSVRPAEAQAAGPMNPEARAEAAAQQSRVTMASVLDSMSQRISTDPDRFASMYEQMSEPGDGDTSGPGRQDEVMQAAATKSVTTGDREVR